ncbi:hypothetical protein BABINDRAFT_162444 [Babjeviella inositovora NRRL Y-12698]|uniref:ATPase expression protein 1 n=1 Tax=Babjeviella inositovora NRRL Y-12698 TaxID=984486 RepID=A0A1E3QM33_9ASCO|nr:uncharacterized protein BABINDRAFT_162444 [Babjeviella inositovora NRRL Y-12698]ODQ78756.1 hypothetical protein BABINDRAFT_162444 [Babjeviella inositovora NRRL Y-12698]
MLRSTLKPARSNRWALAMRTNSTAEPKAKVPVNALKNAAPLYPPIAETYHTFLNLKSADIANMFFKRDKQLMGGSLVHHKGGAQPVTFNSFQLFLQWYQAYATVHSEGLQPIRHEFSTPRASMEKSTVEALQAMSEQGQFEDMSVTKVEELCEEFEAEFAFQMSITPQKSNLLVADMLLYLLQRETSESVFQAVCEFVANHTGQFRLSSLDKIVSQLIYTAGKSEHALTAVLDASLEAVLHHHPNILAKTDLALIETLTTLYIGTGDLKKSTACLAILNENGVAPKVQTAETFLYLLEQNPEANVNNYLAVLSGVFSTALTPVMTSFFVNQITNFAELNALLHCIESSSEAAAIYAVCQTELIEVVFLLEASQSEMTGPVMAAKLAGLAHRIKAHALVSDESAFLLAKYHAYYGSSIGARRAIADLELTAEQTAEIKEAFAAGKNALPASNVPGFGERHQTVLSEL